MPVLARVGDGGVGFASAHDCLARGREDPVVRCGAKSGSEREGLINESPLSLYTTARRLTRLDGKEAQATEGIAQHDHVAAEYNALSMPREAAAAVRAQPLSFTGQTILEIEVSQTCRAQPLTCQRQSRLQPLRPEWRPVADRSSTVQPLEMRSSFHTVGEFYRELPLAGMPRWLTSLELLFSSSHHLGISLTSRPE